MNAHSAPRAFATVTGPVATFTGPDGRVEPLTAPPDGDIREIVVQRAAAEAARAGAAIELITTGDRGIHHLLINADGTMASSGAKAPSTRPDESPAPNAFLPTAFLPTREEHDPSQQGEEVNTETPGRRAVRDTRAPEPLPRKSFIEPSIGEDAAPVWWRAVLARLSGGPAPSEVARRADEHAVAQQWAGCRTIAVANGKGGVGKTMTTAMLAAVFARFGGGNVLAWDNNDTRGTLGWRTEQGKYESTIKDLLPAASDLLGRDAGVSDIARFVHHQSVDRYDVLRSNPELLATDQRIAAEDFHLLMQVAARYYRIVIFDSGNDESAERWLSMVDASYQLVVPTLASPESAESAALLLDALRERDERSRALAESAVVVVTEAEPNRRAADTIADGFVEQVRAVEHIPFDRALKSGPLRLDTLRAPTRDAWLRATASVARGL